MINFESDYVEGCHPAILEKLKETNYEQTSGYGMDKYCESARSKIRYACGQENADVHFLVGGTQTNTTVIASILRPFQGVLSADTGHIASHETGAIEGTGHKVLTLQTEDGTITGNQVEEYYQKHMALGNREHSVQPGMVYISFPTESGTLYSKKQLTELSEACKRCGLPLYLDGARLGYGLASPSNDITLKEIAELCDVFYIGGTKCGALFGEALVITNENLKEDFRYMIKRQGGMLAKGRLLGIQFDVLFENGLYFDICKKAVEYALEIREAFEKKGIPLYGTSMTNQQFPALNKEQSEYLNERYLYEFWEILDEKKSVYRFCTGWATTRENMDLLLADIQKM